MWSGTMPVLVTAVSANSAQCDKYEYKLMTLMKEKLQVQRASETATGFVDGPIWEEDVYDFRRSPSQKDFKAPNPAFAFRVGTTTLYRVLTSSSTSEGGSHLPDIHRWQRRCNWCFHWDTFSFYFMVPRRWEREKGLYLELYLHHWNTSSPSTFLPAARIHCQQLF